MHRISLNVVPARGFSVSTPPAFARTGPRMTGLVLRRAFTRLLNVPVACGLLALMSGCASTSSGTHAAPAAGSGEVTREARLLQMTDRRQLDTVLVDELLRDVNVARRARTALAIGQVKGKARYGKLRHLLVDADTAIAANAAFALGLGRDTASIVALARAVAGAPDPVAIAAAWSLGDIGDPARSVLTLALGEGAAQPLVVSTAAQRSAAVRVALVTAASKLRVVPAATLLPWLNDSDPQVVRAVAYVFARTRVPGGVRALVALRNNSDEETRQHVARMLAKSAAGDSLASRALDALNILVTDTSPRVRVNAVRSLATYGVSVRETVTRALRDSDGNVRVVAAEVILPMLGTDADAWRATWAIDSTLPVRITLLTGARRSGVSALAAAENEWKVSGDWRQRLAVLTAWRADTSRTSRMADVLWAVNDVDSRVKEAGVAALREVVTDEPAMADSARRIWRTRLQEADALVRTAAIRSLATTANADVLPAILDTYTRYLADRDDDARLAAIAYVNSAWIRDSARFTPALRTRLASLAVPRDSAERAAARTATPLAAWKTATVAPVVKPLSDYETLVRRYVLNGGKRATAILHTEKGDITLELFGEEAPLTVDNFVELARRGYYRNTFFHRVVPNFVSQDGDPRGTGSGGPGYAIRDELTRQIHTRGCLAMALSGPDTGGSQYYLCHSPQPHLDGHYTVFGRMLQGFEVLDRIVQTDRILSIEIR